MKHLTVKIFDISLSKITSNVLDMCTTKGVTAADIFDVNTQNQISCNKCVAFSVDNALENMCKSRVLEKNLDVYFVVCPCHQAHIYE
jgi:hypothetical protein